jgi:penicillin-binding protein 1A
VFNGGQETSLLEKIERKLQEQYLAIELEKHLSKEEILEYYLNTINLGQNTLGVEAASKRYFNKSVSKLTLSECAVLAGITQNPAAYNPINHPENNKKKRATILAYMKEQNYISSKDYSDAMADDVYSRIKLVNKELTKSSRTVTSYFEDALFDQVLNDLKTDLGYTETQAYNALYRGGLKIYSTQDSSIQKICDSTINDKRYYPVDSSYQLSYQLSIRHANGKETHYNETHVENYFLNHGKYFSIYVQKKDSLASKLKTFKKAMLKKGDTVSGEVANYIIQPQTSFVLMEQGTGKVRALCGGRGEKLASRTLNRATNTLRQPGSTFKVLSTYLPALDTAGLTLASVEDDAPYLYPGTNRPVRNWYSTGYRGLTTLRTAITQSMNIVTVKTLEKVTPRIGYDYLLNLGFTSLVESSTNKNGETFTDIALPMALGGLTKGVSNLELTGAFATIANKGNYTEPCFYTKIVDHNGKVLINKKPETRQVMKESTAWLLTSAMQDVVNKGTGTRARIRTTNMPMAGKTGTTSKNVDIWFVGYTPYYTAGIWGGYDMNKVQSNTTFHKDIWRTIMEKVSSKQKIKYFTKPSSIVSASICTKCGKLAINGLCNKAEGGSCIKTEYFEVGTVPTEKCDCHIKCQICKVSKKLAGDNCPPSDRVTKIYLQKKERYKTADSPYVLPENLAKTICDHGFVKK